MANIALFRPRHTALGWNVFRSADRETELSFRLKVNLPWSKSSGFHVNVVPISIGAGPVECFSMQRVSAIIATFKRLPLGPQW